MGIAARMLRVVAIDEVQASLTSHVEESGETEFIEVVLMSLNPVHGDHLMKQS